MKDVLKNWRKLLKTFPAKSLNLKNKIAESSAKEIDLKNVKPLKNETLVFSAGESDIVLNTAGQKQIDSKSKASETSEGENLLGELLSYLRTSKLMSTLFLCRQIERIDVSNETAMLFSETADLSELVSNEKHKKELETFFKQKGLGFKILEKKKEFDPTEKLKEFFGDKLTIK